MRLLLSIAAIAAFGGAAMAQNMMTPAPIQPNPTLGAPARPALAGNRGSMMQACQADFQTLCPGMTPGDGKLGPCIRANRAKLTPVCASAMQSRMGAGRMMPPAPPPTPAP
jgi:hypothetical protein